METVISVVYTPQNEATAAHPKTWNKASFMNMSLIPRLSWAQLKTKYRLRDVFPWVCDVSQHWRYQSALQARASALSMSDLPLSPIHAILAWKLVNNIFFYSIMLNVNLRQWEQLTTLMQVKNRTIQYKMTVMMMALVFWMRKFCTSATVSLQPICQPYLDQ